MTRNTVNKQRKLYCINLASTILHIKLFRKLPLEPMRFDGNYIPFHVCNVYSLTLITWGAGFKEDAYTSGGDLLVRNKTEPPTY